MSKVYASVALNERVPDIRVEDGLRHGTVALRFEGDGLILYVDCDAAQAIIEACEGAFIRLKKGRKS